MQTWVEIDIRHTAAKFSPWVSTKRTGPGAVLLGLGAFPELRNTVLFLKTTQINNELVIDDRH